MSNHPLDPAGFYDQRISEEKARQVGLPFFVYETFGPLIRSSALALDPFVEFRISPYKYVKPNRLRHMTIHARTRNYTTGSRVIHGENYPDPSGDSLYDYLPWSETDTGDEFSSWTALTKQPAIQGFCHDTTRKSRLSASESLEVDDPTLSSELGEMEFFRPSYHSPQRRLRALSYEYNGYDNAFDPPPRRIKTRTYALGILDGPFATFSSAGTVLSNERANFDSRASQMAIRLLNESRPERVEFDIIREIGELRDLPMLLRGTVRSVLDQTRDIRSLSQAYLIKEFGWDQIVSSVQKLVATPIRISKRINYLLSRVRKATTFRSSFSTIENVPQTVVFSPQRFVGKETIESQATTWTREIEFRLAANFNIGFPDVNRPYIRSELSRRMWGSELTPRQLYELTPWSWLVDWFTGLGDYVQHVVNLNSDSSVINHGCLTYVSRGRILHNCKLKRTLTSTTSIGPPVVSTTIVTNPVTTVSSVFDYKYQKRVSLERLTAASLFWAGLNLNEYQLSILTALLGSRRG